jgi:C-terminal processing protease CtpA/Prc
MRKLLKAVSLLGIALFGMLACGLNPILNTSVAPTPQPSSNEPYMIKGGFTVTNGFVFENYFIENSVALVDMHGFVIRDNYWELPVDSQVLGYLNVDLATLGGTYELSLPERPQGIYNDVDNNGKTDTGVQIFAVSYFPNLAGGPFAEGDDKSFGWPSYLASVKTDAARDYEVTGGKLVVWASDGNQQFPTGFGTDGKLFTADDPVASIVAGWTIIDLDQSPFTFRKESVPQLTLFEPAEFALKDYSGISYTQSFDKLVEFLRTHYAFNGYPSIEPNWDALAAKFRPDIAQAQANSDGRAFWTALKDFTWAFKDGHVGISDPNGYFNDSYRQATAGGYGFAIRELDDGRVVVIFVLSSGPAASAGMQVGAEVTEFNGKPIKTAIGEVVPWTLPMSSDLDIRYQQARYLLRAPLDTDATVTFSNPGGETQTVTLKSIAEGDSFNRTSVYFNVNTSPYLPVEYSILASGVGYVKVNSYADDLNLTFRLFKRAMDTFKSSAVPGIIIDLRYNSGGNPIGLAGFLINQEIPMPQGYSYSDATGNFEKDGVPGTVLPNVEQYSFSKMAVLVGSGCASACEDEAYSFSKVPGMMVVGMFPTSGTMADVGDGQFSMPDGISMQFPTERFLLSDGSLFLQGTGVQPTMRVPITEDTVMTSADIVLQTAENTILNGSGTGTSASASNGPRVMSISETQNVLNNTDVLEQRASETYTNSDYLTVPKNFKFTINLTHSEPLLWGWGWCAKDMAALTDNLSKIKVTFTLNGTEVPQTAFLTQEGASGGQQCKQMVVAVTDWPSGESKAITAMTFTTSLNDGTNDFPAGDQVFDYVVKLP